ncbi:MAG: Stp1/IreP family PP2C-type Ser/Thr phosphatase [Selenomonas sp.]|uniref:Stp1/IreP family PP2C-type Ser/Thr phosphatase n=1 Tax=Selenomonas sp. TaxID=2053611 RepID=UPI0025E6F877|nr:Stp1/IreP family PP2C-type Ser/Thr phosphatase [Selenomonas sp.]MCI6100686.1 Stp1/IreP family PP2C-type Ser/Thr phosphatase [Selenomonas sp.]MCI6231166.1 Stp1/IreP family PP2C-type Ser/Thr phosphatase [Selenomonas sp.]
MAESFAYTDIGRVRPTNEDSALCFAPGVAVVADGMGGRAAGEVASSLLVQTVREQLLAAPRPWGEEALRQAVALANEKILAEAKKYPACEGMGTTATVLSYADAAAGENGGEAVWAHVGDSRIYLLRGGELRQITRDHSYVEGLVESGSITEAEARKHPRKNVLTRAVGVEPDVEVDTGRLALQKGDTLLLATDGLTNMVEDADIARILEEHPNDPAYALGTAANNAGGRDNITAVVVMLS